MDTIKDLVEMAADLTGLDIELYVEPHYMSEAQTMIGDHNGQYKLKIDKGTRTILQSPRKDVCEAYLDGILFAIDNIDDVLATRFLKQARARS